MASGRNQRGGDERADRENVMVATELLIEDVT